MSAAVTAPYPDEERDVDEGEIDAGERCGFSHAEAPTHEETWAHFMAQLERVQAEHAKHAAACTAEWCDPCGRHACERCRRMRVARPGVNCLDCTTIGALELAQVPRRFLDALPNAKKRVLSETARKLGAQSFAAAKVVLFGPSPGRGKTTAAVAMMTARKQRDLWDRDRGAWRPLETMVFASSLDLVQASRSHPLGENLAPLIQDVHEAGLVLIDDLGAEGSNPQAIDVLTGVIHARHNADLALWITTAFSPAELGAKYGGGVMRRLYEDAVLIDCEGP